MTPLELAAVAAGGAVGAVVRHAVVSCGAAFGDRRGTVAVLVVNLVACGLLGMAVATLPGVWLLAVGTGLAGALSTFSSLALQLGALTRRGEWGTATVIVALTLGGGLLVLTAGAAVGAHVASR